MAYTPSPFILKLRAERAKSRRLRPDRWYDGHPPGDILCMVCNQPLLGDDWWEILSDRDENQDVDCVSCEAEVRVEVDWSPEVTGQELVEPGEEG